MFSLITILSIVVILTTISVPPVLALGDSVQQIHAELNGFTVMSDCCHASDLHVEGNLITNSDGSMELSSQNGVLTIGTSAHEKLWPEIGMWIKSKTSILQHSISDSKSKIDSKKEESVTA